MSLRIGCCLALPWAGILLISSCTRSVFACRLWSASNCKIPFPSKLSFTVSFNFVLKKATSLDIAEYLAFPHASRHLTTYSETIVFLHSFTCPKIEPHALKAYKQSARRKVLRAGSSDDELRDN
jgi:hypothetical protein